MRKTRTLPPHLVWLALIAAAYLGAGFLYATRTPPWQAPDEPAHYNYVRYLVERRRLPTLQPGDYDQAYLQEFTRTPQNVQSLSIAPLRYESWQPPLYYLLAAPVYIASGGSVLALRLFSLLLGAGTVALAFAIVRRLAPGSPALALTASAFVAFVPQHLAMMSSIQNDSLAELLLAGIVLQLVSRTNWTVTGFLLGLGLLTKGTVLAVGLPLVVLALWLAYRARAHGRWLAPAEVETSSRVPPAWGGGDLGWLARHGAACLGLAALVALPLWARNVAVYGWPDVYVTARHDAVVVGQPTPTDWIGQYGLDGYLRRYTTTTFHSFWGQFGWMGVPMSDRYYMLLALLTLAAAAGAAWYIAAHPAEIRRPRFWLLAAWLALAVGTYLVYNLKYVQFQGRYLFPALIPIGLAFAAGLRQWTTILPRPLRDPALALALAGLVALDLIALFTMIVPALSS